jgi:hypothetical protein
MSGDSFGRRVGVQRASARLNAMHTRFAVIVLVSHDFSLFHQVIRLPLLHAAMF